LIVQIETREGLENSDEILSEPGIDGCLIGTGDLSLSLGYPGQVNHPDVIAAAEKIFAKCREKNLLWTIPIRNPDETARWQASGMNMLSLTTDGGLLTAGARQFLSSVRR
jgi:2-keto-3-deoxy-L-rhamnonate aldolase RhmA